MKLLLENWEEFLNEAKLKHGYSIGEIGKDPIAGIDQNKSMYGASMNKPVLAFINLVLAKEGALHNRTGEKIRRLSPEELDKLISYAGGSSSSNRVNRALSDMSSVPGKDPKNQGYYKKYSKQYGVSRDQAKEVLNKLGLGDSIGGVHWGSRYNQQTPQGYNKFMSLLVNMKNDPDSEYHNEASEVLSYIQKRQGGTGAKGLKDRLNKQLEKAGYGKDSIKSMYGKGGYYKGTLNYSVVINDKYVLSLYTDQSDRDLGKMRSKIQDLTLGAIKDNIKPEQFQTPLQTKVPDKPPAPTPPTTDTPSPVATAPKPEIELPKPAPPQAPPEPSNRPEIATRRPSEPEIASPRFERPEEPLPTPAPIKTRSGRFVHDIEELPDFDFDKFYGDLDVQFADQGGAAAMLPSHGTDYKFGREHQKAYQELQKARELEKLPIPTEPALNETYRRWAQFIN